MTDNTGMEKEGLALAALLRALADDCAETDGWQEAAPTCRDAADLIERLTSGIDREAVCLLIERMCPGKGDHGMPVGTEVEALADAIIALIAAAPSSPMEGGWQDVASAPRDGTAFDVWVPSHDGPCSGYRVADLFFAANGKLYRKGFSRPANLVRWPTHWMPLPSPPVSDTPA